MRSGSGTTSNSCKIRLQCTARVACRPCRRVTFHLLHVKCNARSEEAFKHERHRLRSHPKPKPLAETNGCCPEVGHRTGARGFPFKGQAPAETSQSLPGGRAHRQGAGSSGRTDIRPSRSFADPKVENPEADPHPFSRGVCRSAWGPVCPHLWQCSLQRRKGYRVDPS